MKTSSSVEYFRKQAKALSRSIAAGDAQALRRIERHLKDSSNRGLTKCQHVIACEHGFSNWKALVRAEDMVLRLAITMAREPTLNDHGIEINDWDRKLPADERARAFQDARCLLRGKVGDVNRTYEWLLGNLPPVKSANPGVNSYTLKHVAEGDIGYITNGVFIAAALIARYPYRFRSGSNPDFGVSLRALKGIEARQDAAGTRSL